MSRTAALVPTFPTMKSPERSGSTLAAALMTLELWKWATSHTRKSATESTALHRLGSSGETEAPTRGFPASSALFGSILAFFTFRRFETWSSIVMLR